MSRYMGTNMKHVEFQHVVLGIAPRHGAGGRLPLGRAGGGYRPAGGFRGAARCARLALRLALWLHLMSLVLIHGIKM